MQQSDLLKNDGRCDNIHCETISIYHLYQYSNRPLRTRLQINEQDMFMLSHGFDGFCSIVMKYLDLSGFQFPALVTKLQIQTYILSVDYQKLNSVKDCITQIWFRKKFTSNALTT